MIELDVGDPAPDIALSDYDGNTVKLSDYRGEWVVLVFYPFSFSGVCSRELKTYAADLAEFTAKGARVVGISIDSRYVQRAFAEKLALSDDLALLSDFPDKQATRAYGAYEEEQGVARRVTAVIDPTGNAVEYRLVIGVLNNSGRVGSGSTEIRLRFEAPINRRGVSPRC